MLACSFPYVRDWLNKHPFKNTAEARLICSLQNGAPIKPDSLCTVMKQLRQRIIRMLECGTINNIKEKEKLEYLLRTKKWNPYCLRHSAITYDSDYLPEYAVKKKARWSITKIRIISYIQAPSLNRNPLRTLSSSAPVQIAHSNATTAANIIQAI